MPGLFKCAMGGAERIEDRPSQTDDHSFCENLIILEPPVPCTTEAWSGRLLCARKKRSKKTKNLPINGGFHGINSRFQRINSGFH